MLTLRTAGLLLLGIGIVGVPSAALALLGLAAAVLPAVFLLLSFPLMPAADAALRGATDRSQRLRASFGLLLWFAGAGIVVFGWSLQVSEGVLQAGYAIAALSAAVLAIAGWDCLQPAANRAERRRARGQG